MATGSAVLVPGNDARAVVGSGSGEGSLTLCSMTVGAQERGLRVTALAWSSAGERLSADGIGAILPDDGVSPNAGMLLFEGHPALPADSSLNRIDLVVNGSLGVIWRGYLRIEPVPDYSA